ncbi:MAG: ABC transporter ATP-binding protein [Eubacteriaceae bacterium]|nr:ABC transporter ATP-binding protein [Eubacteriaceae bacterium]
MIEIKDLSKSYNGKAALKDINLKLPRGEIVGLFGENGAGKTTLMKAILGLIDYRGEVTLDGQRITRANSEKLAFATSEHSFFPNLSPASHRDFYAEHFPAFSEKRYSSLMDFFELPAHKALRHFSAGQKNQFEVIMALCQGADYILMDEPFAGNDIFNREDFYKVLVGILEPRETLVLSTHLIEEVSSIIGRAVLLNKGVIAGDVYTDALEESGEDLIGYIKGIYHYRADRVAKALGDMTR